MNPKALSRIIVALILGAVIAIGLHQRMEKHRVGGREAFLAEQSTRWDRTYAHPHRFALAASLVVGISGAVLVFGVYELLVAGVVRLLRQASSNDDRS